MIVFHYLRLYWDWAGSNVGAMPGCGAVAIVFAVCFRKPIATWWHKHFGAQADLDEIKKIAGDAHAAVEKVLSAHGDLTRLLDRHHQEMHRRFDDHAVLVSAAVAQAASVVVAADEPVKAGAGSNPAMSERLDAETSAAARRADADGLVDAPAAVTTSRKPRSPARPKGM